jgi:hypothetical protein
VWRLITPHLNRWVLRYAPLLEHEFRKAQVSSGSQLANGRDAVERAMRPIPLGRKNWLHGGSEADGERAAAILSLTETAKLNMLDPKDYLRQDVERIADHPVKRVHELLPWNLASVRARLDQHEAT